MGNLAEEVNDFKAFSGYRKQYDSLSEIYNAQDKARKVEELQALFELDKKEEQLQRSMLALKRQREIITASIAVGILLVLVLILLVLMYRQKSKIHKEQQRLNAVIVEQAEELKQKNAAIISINENLEKLITERTHKLKLQNEILKQYTFLNAHKVRGPLARILGLAGLYIIGAHEN